MIAAPQVKATILVDNNVAEIEGFQDFLASFSWTLHESRGVVEILEDDLMNHRGNQSLRPYG